MRARLFAIGACTVLVLACGAESFSASAEPGEKAVGLSVRSLSPAELKGMLDRKDFTFLNVHIPYEGEIARTDAHIPFDKVEQQLYLLPRKQNAKIVLYCMSGRMSEIAATTLAKLGYGNVSHLDGGMLSWQKAGYPLKNFRPAQ
jgi:rhodanese-related sulfurtransferase